MNSRCKSCMYRAADGGGSGGCCAYLQITGKSRLKEVYKRLGVNWMTDAVRVAMRPENCMCYCEGERAEIEDGRRIALEGSMPEPGAGERGGQAKKPKKQTPKTPRQPRPPKWDQDRARELWQQGRNDHEIGKELGIDSSTVQAWRKRLGLMANYGNKARPSKILALLREGKCDSEIAKELGLSKDYVTRWRNKRRLKRNPEPEELAHEAKMKQRMALYCRGLSDREIAKKLGLLEKSVAAWRWQNGLPRVIREGDRGSIDQTKAWEMYRAGATDGEISAALGVKSSSVCSWRRRRGLPCNPEREKNAPAWEGKARELLAAGLSDAAIGAAIGRSRQSVNTWRRRRGLPCNPEKPGPKKKEKAHGNL